MTNKHKSVDTKKTSKALATKAVKRIIQTKENEKAARAGQ